MRTKYTIALYAIYIFAGFALLHNVAVYAQVAGADSAAQDKAAVIVITANVLAAFTVPFMGYATQQNPFDIRQYILAVFIVFVGSTMVSIQTTLENLTVEGLSTNTAIQLFISVFTAAMAVEYGKSRTIKGIREGRKINVSEKEITIVDDVFVG